MSYRDLSEAFTYRDLPTAEKIVLLCIANYADKATGHAYPRQAELAKDTGLSRQRVNQALKELERLGLISRTAQYRDDGSRRASLLTIFPLSRITTPHVAVGDIPYRSQRQGDVSDFDTRDVVERDSNNLPNKTYHSKPAVVKNWNGPSNVRMEVVAELSEEAAISFIDPATWREPATIIAHTGFAADKLRRLACLSSYSIVTRAEEAA